MIRHHLIQSSTRSWESLFAEACKLASKLGPARLVAISHGADSNAGTVTLWSRKAPAGPRRWMRSWFVRSSMRSWQQLFDEVAAFASQLEEGQLFDITHSADSNEGVITVWYWVDQAPKQRKRARGRVSIAPTPGGALSEPEGD